MSTNSVCPTTPTKKWSSALINQPEYILTGCIIGTPIHDTRMETPIGKNIRNDDIPGVRKKTRSENLSEQEELWGLMHSSR